MRVSQRNMIVWSETTAMKTVIAFVLLVAAGTTNLCASESKALTGDSLRKAVSGKTVYLRTQGIEIPISYSTNGTMSGRLKAFVAALAGGTPSADKGKWWIKDDRLCQQWKKWLDGRSYCYRLKREGSLVRWSRDDGRSGTLRISG